MRRRLLLVPAITGLGLALMLASAPLLARENVILVLDASGSMWGQIDGRSKVEIARDAVAGLLDSWNTDHHLGLMAYGHNRRGDCADIELLIEPGPLDASQFRRTVNSLNARGMTPLSAAVQQAAAVLQSSEQRATVILVSDGEENCGLDPCQIGSQLAAEGIDFTAHVVGFDLGDAAREAGLRCLAENTGGMYFRADDAASLSQSLGTLALLSTETVRQGGSATLKAPASAVEATRIMVGYTGPAERGDYLAVVDGEGRERGYSWVGQGETQGELLLQLPPGPGIYALRYVAALREPPVLAEQALELSPAEAMITGPENVPQGSLVNVQVRGPVGNGRNWLTIVPVGAGAGESLGWQHLTEPEQSFELLAPSEPGEYELRFVLEGNSVLVSRPLRVSPAEILINGPEQVGAGERFDVRLVGPKHSDFWITIVEPDAGDGAYRSWAALEIGRDSYDLIAPSAPGNYELRYLLTNPFRVIARQPIEVLAAAVRWQAPASVTAGERFSFVATGPSGEGSYLTLVPAGSPEGHYETWQWTSADGVYDWIAPDSAGSWELRYVLGDGATAAAWPLAVQ
ncbi:MAG: VWA domain-containing protein [Wenzhouxiangella sp.]|nr:VWA domain-containing protein [Wenzhouxiangella sp.]